MSVIDNLLWKPVSLNVAGDFEGLAGFEEITDYNIETFKPTTGKPRTKLKEKKKKKTLLKNSHLKKTEGKTKPKVQTNVFVEEPINERDINETDYYPWNNIYVPKEISRALLEKGFSEPTEIQKLAIPPALRGKKDILGAAETGSGKTLAFAIPIIYGILKNLEIEKENSETNDINERLWALILTPTRELAIQVKCHIETAINYTPLRVAVVVGGMSADKQSRLLKRRPHIVVATPGRLWDLITNSYEPHLADIENIRYLVIDETDRMVEKNHFPELLSLIETLNTDRNKVRQRQYFVFSATLSLVHQVPSYLQKKKRGKKVQKGMNPEQKLDNFIKLLGMNNPKVVDITNKSGTASGLIETKIATSFDEKDFYLYYLLSVHPGRALVFCNSISCVRRLASLLTALNLKPLPLHANMQQRQRLKNLDRFKTVSRGLLLATDVAARGLDIPSVEHVIHYQVPRTSETYIHRSGRTARAQRRGLTVLLIEPGEVNLYAKMCATLGREKDVPDFPVDLKALQEAKMRVKLAREIDKISLSLRKERSQIGWLEKTAEEMDVVLDEDQMPSKSDDSEIAKQKHILETTKKNLRNLLDKPIATDSSISDINDPEMIKKKMKIFKKKKKF